MATTSKLQVVARMSASILLPAIPIGGWYYTAVTDRHAKQEEVRTRVRIPNVQTVDDLMIEKCQPGDVILFDRRCHKCAAGPLSAFSCVVGKSLLCDDSEKGNREKTVDIGQFEHVGIVVPGYNQNSKASDKLDPSNLLLLEATASEGVTARPFLTRLEMTQSRTVLLLPLASPGERRNATEDDGYEHSNKTKRLHQHMEKGLIKFRDTWTSESEKQNYGSAHASLGLIGALGYALNLYKTSRAPVSPSAWLVVSALQESGAGMFLSERTAMESRVEDFLRDYRFCDGDNAVRLRPGWRFMSPVIMRETARS